MSTGPVVVGFDLDMTLIDSRAGIAATYRALSRLTGVAIDAQAAVGRLGPPLEHEIARWFPAERVPAATASYRRLYPRYAIAATRALPGALAALAAVHAAGGRVLVLTAKREPLARLHLDHLSLDADVLVGDAWAGAKTGALGTHRAFAYVGDHVADVAAARAAGVSAVGVATGPCDADELVAAGAQVVLTDLCAFPAWLATALAGRATNPVRSGHLGWTAAAG